MVKLKKSFLDIFRRRVGVSSSRLVLSLSLLLLLLLLPQYRLFGGIKALQGFQVLPLGFLRVALKVLTSFVEYGFLLLDLSVALRVHQNFVGFPSGHPRVFKDSLLSSHFFSSSWRLKGFSVLFILLKPLKGFQIQFIGFSNTVMGW